MNPLFLAILVGTAVISYKGFNDRSFFEKYKFQIGAIEKGQYYRLLTSGFLHADWMHFGMNMLSLYFFSEVVFYFFGDIGYVVIYIGSILLGNLFSLFIYKKQYYYSAIGASGGVSGVIFAAIAMAPDAISVNFLPGYIFGFIYFAYSVYMMLNPKQWDNFGHSAHLGGAFFGLVYAIFSNPELAIHNSRYTFIMSLPLLYLAYMISAKKIR